MSEVDCGTRIIDQRSQHSGTGPDKHVYYHIGTYIRQNHCDICITMQYGSSLLQHWSSFCRVAGRYTVIVYADQRSSAGLVQIIYIIYNARHRITIENKTGCCGPVVRGGYHTMNRKYITIWSVR